MNGAYRKGTCGNRRSIWHVQNAGEPSRENKFDANKRPLISDVISIRSELLRESVRYFRAIKNAANPL